MLNILISSLCLGMSLFLGVLYMTPVWDQLSASYFNHLNQRFQQLNLPTFQLHVILRVWGISMIAVFVVGVAWNSVPLAIAAALFVATLPSHILKYMIAKREIKLRDQMVQASKALANSVRAGLSFKQALEAITEDTAAPLRQEFQRIVFDIHHGRTPTDVLNDTRSRLNVDAFSMFSAAICVNLERGGKLTQSLERISRSLQENQRLDRKLSADTAAGRHMLLILSVFPLFFLVVFGVLDPQGTSLLLSTLAGQCILVFVGAVVYGGVWWGRRVMNIDM